MNQNEVKGKTLYARAHLMKILVFEIMQLVYEVNTRTDFGATLILYPSSGASLTVERSKHERLPQIYRIDMFHMTPRDYWDDLDFEKAMSVMKHAKGFLEDCLEGKRRVEFKTGATA